MQSGIEQWPVQSIPGVGTIFGWDVETLMQACRAHVAGSFTMSGRLMDSIKTNPIIRHGIDVRESSTRTLPQVVLPGGGGPRGGQPSAEAVRCADRWRELLPEILPDSTRDDWWLHYNFMARSTSVMDWEERTDGRDRFWLPRIKPWHPSNTWVTYRPDLGVTSPNGNVLMANTRNGPVLVDGGDGRWVNFQMGTLDPHLNALVLVLGEPFLGDTYTLRDNMALMEQYGQGIKKLIHPASWKASQINEKLHILRTAGHGGVISCPVDQNGRKVDVENVQVDAGGANIFEMTENRLLKRFLISLLGQNMTTVGQAGGYAQAVVHSSVLWDKKIGDAAAFGDARYVCTLDSKGQEKRQWVPYSGPLRRHIARWYAYFNDGEFDFAPFTFYNALPPEDAAAKAQSEAQTASTRATALSVIVGAIYGSGTAPGLKDTLGLSKKDCEFIVSQAGFALHAPEEKDEGRRDFSAGGLETRGAGSEEDPFERMNDAHEPPGSPQGGQFAPGGGLASHITHEGAPDTAYAHQILHEASGEAGMHEFLQKNPLGGFHVGRSGRGVGSYQVLSRDLHINPYETSKIATDTEKHPFQYGKSFNVRPGKKDPTGALTMKMVTTHELSHHLYYTGLDTKHNALIAQGARALFSRAKAVHVSEYARVDHLEWFAETHTAYVHFNGELKKKDPAAHAYFGKVRKAMGLGAIDG